MSLSETKDLALEANAQVENLTKLMGKLLDEGLAAEVDERAVQQLLTLGVKLYAAKMELESDFPPFAETGGVTATDVMIIISEMLKSQDLELFELGMWQAAWRKG